jgi:hypothetical protein
MNIKLVELFANRVDERRNMINDYLRERACIENVRGSVGFCFCCVLSFSCSSKLLLALSCHFAWICRFSCPFAVFCGFPSSR